MLRVHRAGQRVAVLLTPLVGLVTSALLTSAAPIPHGQAREPGPALSADEAMAAMKLPEGFNSNAWRRSRRS